MATIEELTKQIEALNEQIKGFDAEKKSWSAKESGFKDELAKRDANIQLLTKTAESVPTLTKERDEYKGKVTATEDKFTKLETRYVGGLKTGLEKAGVEAKKLEGKTIEQLEAMAEVAGTGSGTGGSTGLKGGAGSGGQQGEKPVTAADIVGGAMERAGVKAQ